MITTIHVPCNDKAYHWVLDWISREASKSSQHLAIRTEWEEEVGGHVSAKYLVEPSPGVHVFRWGGAWIKLDRIREQGGVPWETITLTTIGRKRPLLLKMLEETTKDVLAGHAGLTLTYGSCGSDWRELCAPHRRGMLLHGPPGCGKTSVIVTLAGHLGLGISILSLADPNITDSSLQARVADVPRNTLLLLEDIDAAFISRETGITGTAHGGLSQVTLTGLINALDGIVASEARLTFLTTNYPDRLDPALIRPGRVDVKQYIG